MPLLKGLKRTQRSCVLLNRTHRSFWEHNILFGFHKSQKIRKKEHLSSFLGLKNNAHSFEKNMRSFKKNPKDPNALLGFISRQKFEKRMLHSLTLLKGALEENLQLLFKTILHHDALS